MQEPIQNFRQPMVTAIGIILGFVLGFSGKWATEPVSETSMNDVLVGIGLFLSILFLIIAMFRILNSNYPSENIKTYYQKTLLFFIFGLSFAFAGTLLAIFQTILN